MTLLNKRCSKCKEVKLISEFNKDKSTKDGLEGRCKICDREKVKSWRKRNLDKDSAKTSRRRSAKLKRMLKWGKEHLKSEIDNWYRRAQIATVFMGEVYHVDHIVPLQGKNVSGLHVPWNLQLLTRSENISKGNRHVC